MGRQQQPTPRTSESTETTSQATTKPTTEELLELLKRVEGFVGKTNSEPFLGFPAGSLKVATDPCLVVKDGFVIVGAVLCEVGWNLHWDGSGYRTLTPALVPAITFPTDWESDKVRFVVKLREQQEKPDFSNTGTERPRAGTRAFTDHKNKTTYYWGEE